MFTPATTASSTSAPATIIRNALATQVSPSTSFHWLPLAEATTTGPAAPFVSTCGACPELVEGAWPKAGVMTGAEAAANAPAAAAAATTSRRLGVGFRRAKHTRGRARAPFEDLEKTLRSCSQLLICRVMVMG